MVSFEERQGGFSFGVLGVATLADGGRVFVKAVRDDAGNAADYRTEALVAAVLPRSVPTPRLLFAVEAGGWFLLCFEVAPGALAREPWQLDELAAALDMLDTCARELTPSPVHGLPTLGERLAGRCETWRGLERDGVWGLVESIGAWERGHLSRLAAVEGVWSEVVVGDSLVHFDPRFDNILVDPATGTARIVDWGRACLGPAWTDRVCLLLQSDLGGLDPEPLLGSVADADQVDAFLVALASYWTHTAALPGLEHAPHLRQRREQGRRATIGWLENRWAGR